MRLGDPEKKAAREAERQARQAEKERVAAARAEEQRRAQFAASPAGQARAAFERGDDLYQFVLDVRSSSTFTIPLWKTGAITTSSDPSEILNSIARQGWRLVTGSFVFHETGSESRDKFMATGQHIAVRGTVVGYYLFARDESKLDPDRDIEPKRAADQPQLEGATLDDPEEERRDALQEGWDEATQGVRLGGSYEDQR